MSKPKKALSMTDDARVARCRRAAARHGMQASKSRAGMTYGSYFVYDRGTRVLLSGRVGMDLAELEAWVAKWARESVNWLGSRSRADVIDNVVRWEVYLRERRQAEYDAYVEAERSREALRAVVDRIESNLPTMRAAVEAHLGAPMSEKTVAYLEALYKIE